MVRHHQEISDSGYASSLFTSHELNPIRKISNCPSGNEFHGGATTIFNSHSIPTPLRPPSINEPFPIHSPALSLSLSSAYRFFYEQRGPNSKSSQLKTQHISKLQAGQIQRKKSSNIFTTPNWNTTLIDSIFV